MNLYLFDPANPATLARMTDQNKSNENSHSSSANLGNSEPSNRNDQYGYDFYPERHGRQKKTSWGWMTEGRSASRAFKCISNVYWCTQNSPLVKLMMGALKSHGCPVDLERHVSCEDCTARVNGGFDPTMNQVVVCQNNSTSKSACCSVMAHELLHMFDYCRAKVDFTNIEHLACTEIRAANFFHCSALSAMAEGDAYPFNYKQKHQECVKKKALMSILMVRDVSREEAVKVVNKVFTKCYNDLEPIGRIPRRNSRDAQRALGESYLYGYTD